MEVINLDLEYENINFKYLKINNNFYKIIIKNTIP